MFPAHFCLIATYDIPRFQYIYFHADMDKQYQYSLKTCIFDHSRMATHCRRLIAVGARPLGPFLPCTQSITASIVNRARPPQGSIYLFPGDAFATDLSKGTELRVLFLVFLSLTFFLP